MGSTSRRVPLVSLDGGAAAPLYDQIYRGLRQLIASGELDGGTQLASTRTLASEWGVSRFTVVSAMDRLQAEGYLTSRSGSGTFVAEILPERSMRAAPQKTRPRARADVRGPELSARGRALAKVVITGPRFEGNETRPFHPRRPALDAFPSAAWAGFVRRQWKSYRRENLDYGDPAGYRPLREAIAEHIGITRGVRCTAENVIVTSGAQQAFDILFRQLLDTGDGAWIEEPGYLDVRAALVAAGARLVPVPMDGQGILVDEGRRRANGARLAVVSPSHQYPSGATLSVGRRAVLLEWAREAGAWIIEDDYDSYFRYRGRPLSAVQQLDPERVIYVGTFSKTMFPSLRLGFCVVPEWLAPAVANARAVADRNSPVSDQAALAAFIAGGDYDRHLRRSRLLYQERYEAMRFHFQRVLGGAVTLAAAAAGTHVLGWLDGSATMVAKAAEEENLVIFPLSRYCLEAPVRDGLVLGYGGLTMAQIASGAEGLARAIERVHE